MVIAAFAQAVAFSYEPFVNITAGKSNIIESIGHAITVNDVIEDAHNSFISDIQGDKFHQDQEKTELDLLMRNMDRADEEMLKRAPHSQEGRLLAKRPGPARGAVPQPKGQPKIAVTKGLDAHRHNYQQMTSALPIRKDDKNSDSESENPYSK